MNIVCLDMEGVLVPEIWIAFAEESGIPELRRTTRDEPDYDKLMRWRIDLLRQRGLKLSAIQETISRIDPLPGAKAFLDELRKDTQVVILSDTFDQFAMPLMAKLGYPTLLCNTLAVDEEGYITRHIMRCEHSKLTTVKALQSIGYDTIASGDSCCRWCGTVWPPHRRWSGRSPSSTPTRRTASAWRPMSPSPGTGCRRSSSSSAGSIRM